VWDCSAAPPLKVRQQLIERGSDPKDGFERPRLERRQQFDFLIRASACRRRGPLIAGDRKGVVRVWRGDAAPRILPEDGRIARSPVVTAVVATERQRIGRVPAMASARGGGIGAPCLADHGDVLPGCQEKHNREQDCAEHVILASSNEQERGQSEYSAATTG